MDIEYYKLTLNSAPDGEVYGILRKTERGLEIFTDSRRFWKSYPCLYDFLSGDDDDAWKITKAEAEKILECWSNVL